MGAERWARKPVGDWAAAGRPPVPGACPQPARSHRSHRPPPQVGVVLWPWAVQVVQVLGVILQVKQVFHHYHLADHHQFQLMVEQLVQIHLALPLLVQHKMMVLLL